MNIYTVNVDVENNSNQPLEGVSIAVDNLTTITSPSANTNTNTTTTTNTNSTNNNTSTTTTTNPSTNTNTNTTTTTTTNTNTSPFLYNGYIYSTQKIMDGYNSADNQQTSFLYKDVYGYAIYDVTGTCNSQQVWNVTMTQRGTGKSNTITIVPNDAGFGSALLPLSPVELNIALYKMNASQSVITFAIQMTSAVTGDMRIYSSQYDFNGMPYDGFIWLKDDPSKPVTPWVSLTPQQIVQYAGSDQKDFIYINVYNASNPSQSLGTSLNVTITIGNYFSFTGNTSNGVINFTCPMGLPDQAVIKVQGNTYYQSATATFNQDAYNQKTYSIGVTPTDVPIPPPPSPYVSTVDIYLIPELPDGTVLTNAQVTDYNNFNQPVSSQTGPVYVQLQTGTIQQFYSAKLSGYTFNVIEISSPKQSGTQVIYGVQNPVQVNKGSIYPMMLMTLPNPHTALYDSNSQPLIYIVPQSAINSLITTGTISGPWGSVIPFGTANWTPSQIGIVQLALAPSTPWGSVLIFETSPLPEQIVSIVRYLYIPNYPTCPIIPDAGYVINLFNGTSMSSMKPIMAMYTGVGTNYIPTSWAYIITFSDNSQMAIGPFTSTTSLPSNLQYVYPLSSIPSCGNLSNYNYNISIPSWIYSG